MRFYCQRNELYEALSIVSKAMASRAVDPIIEGVRITGKPGALELYCTDLNIAIRYELEADVDEDFSCVMPGKLFVEVVKRMPEDEICIEFTEAKEGSFNANLTCLSSETRLTALPSENFPRQTVIEDKDPVAISERDLKNMIMRTIFAVSHESTRPVFTGELVEIDGDAFNLVALDGFKFALRSMKLESPSGKRRCVVPGRALLEVARILSDTEDIVYCHFTDRAFMFEKGPTRLTTRLLEGDFIDYSKIIPKDSSTTAEFNISELQKAVARAELLAQDGRVNLVKFNIANDVITITANSEAGFVKEQVGCNLSGPEMDLAFNTKYLIETLSAIDAERAVMRLTSSLSAMTMKPVGGGNEFLYLVLPVLV